jgi:hypothetical protein
VRHPAPFAALCLAVVLGGCSASSTPQANPSKTARPATAGLVASGYGFLVPDGWTKHPLANDGGPASFASFQDPTSGARIDYVENGGSAGVIYDAHDKPVVEGLEDLAQCDHVTHHVRLSASRVAYSCTSSSHGLVADGVIAIRPFAEGYVDLLVQLPAKQHALATRILNSLPR